MAITPFEKDIEIIQKLDDEPNDVQGLSPAELKRRFDQAAIWLKDYINNTLIPALSGDSSGGTGADNIGASVQDFSGSTVQAILAAFNDALVDRYTKGETNSYVGEQTNNLVSSVSVENSTGVITVTKKDGSKQTFDTALEKVPSSMELVEEGKSVYLVITNQDGSKTQTDVSKLIDQYVFNNSEELSFDTGKSGTSVTVTATIRPNSIGLDRFKAEVTSALEQYNATSENNADYANAAASHAERAMDSAKEAASIAESSASSASKSASSAASSAALASQSASSASASAQSAQSNAAQALESKNSASASARSAKEYSGKPPITQNGTWWVWDANQKSYVDTGVSAKGEKGDPGTTVSAEGLFGFNIDNNGDLILSYTGEDVPPFSIDNNGDLIYTLNGREVNLGHVVGGGGEGGGGTPGQAATITVGETITGEPGTNAGVVNVGTSNAAVLKFTIPRGTDGKDGPTGPAGADGHTPTRGVDYWTAADRQAIVSDVLAELSSGDEVSY